MLGPVEVPSTAVELSVPVLGGVTHLALHPASKQQHMGVRHSTHAAAASAIALLLAAFKEDDLWQPQKPLFSKESCTTTSINCSYWAGTASASS
jgi:hypothetical protein